MISTQENNRLPYYEIPEYSEDYNAGAVAARMIDGLGFRYYWATEGLVEKDLKFKISIDARSTDETLDHILNLSRYILNAALKQTNEGGAYLKMTFLETRKKTLENLKTAADILRKSSDLSENELKFNEQSKYPFWNVINGPIADAIWHCGQIVASRRASGNPINSKVSVLSGKIRD